MNAIIGFSNLASKTDLTPRQKDYISKIEISAKNLLGILNDILDFSKIEAGKLEIESVDFDLEGVVDGVLNLVSIRTAEKGLELLNHIDANVPLSLVGDPLRLGQVLVNLANNAVKFTNHGQVAILVSTEAVTSTECILRFTVKDSGIGIAADRMDRLFQPFSQADGSVTREFGGTGLGLSISRRLVELMDGRIGVESTEGVGSSFSFTARFGRQTTEKHKSRIIPADLAGYKVLVVDDNRMARDLLSEQLSAFGFDVHVAASGEDAMDLLVHASSSKPYNLVLMDWSMPGMDGIETARRLLADGFLEKAPLVFMVSAFGREEIVRKAERVGIKAFLMKPVNQSLLFDTMMEFIGVRQDLDVEARVPGRYEATASQDFQGVKVLLAEDNPMNQQIATEVLQGAGMEVVVANHGKEAVDFAKAEPFDLVLMDVQMPVMGGYEATRLIRAHEAGTGRRVPIVAMTAHAMQGVREECLQVGMDDYVSKPIDTERLFRTLSKWVTSRAEDGETPSARATPANSAPADPSAPSPEDEALSFLGQVGAIDMKRGLDRLNLNARLYRKLLVEFAEKYGTLGDRLLDLLLRQDPQALQSQLHSLKGVAGNLSIREVHALASELENADISASGFESRLRDLDAALRSVASDVSQAESAMPSRSDSARFAHEAASGRVSSPLPSEQLQTLVYDILGLLESDNLEAERSLEKFLGSVDREAFAEELQEIHTAVRSFDFEAAIDPFRRVAQGSGYQTGGAL
jgi:two-component system sensor histidine kinase/response regulator